MSNTAPSPAPADAPFAVRRVITGHDQLGKSIVLSDGASPLVFSPPTLPGYSSHDIFRTFESPAKIAVQTAETTEGPRRQLPTPSGTVIRISRVPPTGERMAQLRQASASTQAFKELGNSKGHTGHHATAKNPLMHRTETIDYVVVLSGELTLVLDEVDVVLRAGDVLVQCGTNHAWENRSHEPATVMFILMDGAYQDALKDLLSTTAEVSTDQ
ncbi:MAG: cupin [Burkholderiales bacterium PBB5]|nr:MAG: cupin [Burkholderiales bacterium PBB5]